jgi:heptosyltransferase-1
MTRLLVVRLGSLGDLVHTLPAVSAIRRSAPDAAIDWLADAVHRDFLALVPIVTDIITLRDRTASAWLEARRELRPRRYDVALDFQGLLKSAALARLSGAKRVVGFDRHSLRERVAAPFYTERIVVGEGRHVIQKNLRLAASVGARSDTIEFPIATMPSAIANEFLTHHPGPYALVNPGAAWPNKQWPPDRLGTVARTLRDRHGLTPVVLWGPGEESPAAAVRSASGGSAVVAPATGLVDLVALARGARLIVSGDTGPLHIAAALGVPAVALFGPTDAGRNGPWNPSDITLSRYDTCDCHYERRCRHDTGQWCLATIGVADVLAAIDTRLATGA